MKANNLIDKILSACPNKLIIGVLVAIISAGFFVSGIAMAANGGASSNNSERLVTISDNGNEKTVLTRANTVRAALKDANVSVNQDDNIEPEIDAELTGTSNKINIYRARPIIVRDGNRIIRVTTMAQSPIAIAAVADIKLYPEDKTILEPVKDFLGTGGARLQLNITRAKVVKLKLYGRENEMRTHATSVREFLKEKDISLGPNDVVSVDLDAKISDKMRFEIWRNGIQVVTVDEEIDFEIEQVRDPEKEVGYHEIKEAGIKGKRSVMYEIKMENGEEVSRREIQSVTSKEPQKQIEVIGIKINLPSGSHEDWMNSAGIPASDYGYVNFIFSRESGWRPNAANPSGKYVGLGQTSPTNLSGACPNWQSDPICQIRFFDGYAKNRYGSWASAYDFWTSHNWW